MRCFCSLSEKSNGFALFLPCRENLVHQDVLECQALLEELCLDQR